jgi:methylenetetrahydrofolate reductase (NADPH)
VPLGLRRQGDRIGKLLTVQTPDYLVDGLAGRIDHFHLYTFGGVKRSTDWLTARQADLALSA